MEQTECDLASLTCKNRNSQEVRYWKKVFSDKKPIPMPIVKDNEVIAFQSSFFALKELGLKKSWVLKA